jgi:hypothetical protein
MAGVCSLIVLRSSKLCCDLSLPVSSIEPVRAAWRFP